MPPDITDSPDHPNTTGDIETLPGALAREISRVTALREQYREMERMRLPGVNCAPAIALMTFSIDRAVKCAGSPDIQGQALALRDLQGFTE